MHEHASRTGPSYSGLGVGVGGRVGVGDGVWVWFGDGVWV